MNIDYLIDLTDNEMFDFEESEVRPTTIYFEEDTQIDLHKGSILTYHNTNEFNKKDAADKNWHEIVVHHNAKYSKNDILTALFNTVGNVRFYPIKYIEKNREDRFMVRQCYEALDNLFRNKLILKTAHNKPPLYLSIKLNVAPHKSGQIIPQYKIENLIDTQIKNLKTHNDVNKVLDLSNLVNHRDLKEVIVYLGITEIFSTLCDRLSRKFKNSIKGLDLSNNHIKSLRGMTYLKAAKLKLIDLRLNNISDINQLYVLECLDFTELYISGNPIENQKGILDKIKEHFPKLLKLDGTLISELTSIGDITKVDPCDVELNGDLLPVFNTKELCISNVNEKWHQIKIMHNGEYTQEEIVEALFKFFIDKNNTEPFYICYYKTGATEDKFLVRKQYEHIKILLENKLILPINKKTITVGVILDAGEFKKEHVSEDLISLALRDCHKNKVLNLSNFSISSSILKGKIIVNMNSPKIYGKYLSTSYSNFPEIQEINLSNNNISNYRGFKILRDFHSLKSLNLSNNNLLDLHDLTLLKNVKQIIDLHLNGNPLCSKYKLTDDYIRDVKSFFPNLKNLDGVRLEDAGSYVSKKNYICNIEALDLIEQFVIDYFKKFEKIKKEDLFFEYSVDAIFTICNYSAHPIRKKKFINLTRNLLQSREYTRNAFVGMEIYETLKELPRFEHDFHSFTTDTYIYRSDLIAFTVTGVLRVLATQIDESDMCFGFSRSFVLKNRGNDIGIGLFKPGTEYVINNDQLSLTDPSSTQQKRAFRIQSPNFKSSIQAVETIDKRSFVLMFQQLTTLRIQWCRRCLEEGEYNFKKSLEIFLNYNEQKLFPKNAFINNSN